MTPCRRGGGSHAALSRDAAAVRFAVLKTEPPGVIARRLNSLGNVKLLASANERETGQGD
jgi:hypothetical protein